MAMNSCVTTTSGIGRKRLACRGGHVVETHGPEGVELQVTAFDPAEIAQACKQGFKVRRRLVGAPYSEPGDGADLGRLRTRGQRPGCYRAAEKCDELASLHVPSARTTLCANG